MLSAYARCARAADSQLNFQPLCTAERRALVRVVGLQPTVITSRAPHLLLEQSVMTKIQKIVDVHRPSMVRATNVRFVRPCYGPLFPARASRAKEKGDHNMGAETCQSARRCLAHDCRDAAAPRARLLLNRSPINYHVTLVFELSGCLEDPNLTLTHHSNPNPNP